MTAFVRTAFANNFINRAKLGDKGRLFEAMAPGHANQEKAINQIFRQPDFVIAGTTNDNTAVLNAGAEQSFLVNLSDEGVTFPAGYDRDIVVECWTQDESTRNYQMIKQTVRGSSTAPTIVSGVQNVGPLVGGRVTFATAVATAADAFGGFSITGAATATGRYAFALPKARRVIVDAMHITHVGTGDLSAVGTHCHLNALTLATGVGEVGIREGLDANVAPADTAQLSMLFDVLPVESCELAIATVPTPDEVLVGALGQASENVIWLAHVYVGELYPNTLATASE